ncbi:hypothetical protein [Lysobacter enzymogenes]|uniref:hypothetical protein n=1 Tax=Lysobacter enzymogenes TaxID=69 RepID=UPI001AFACF6C|nr:hypothetical protein [Lysobacter enzymogenes]QQQ01894.1 hypothetical protein JHW41_02580 [Lysobacter enzymogenes]
MPVARRIAQSLGVPLAFLYADTDVLAEAILTLGLLSKSEQRKVVATSRPGWRRRAGRATRADR